MPLEGESIQTSYGQLQDDIDELFEKGNQSLIQYKTWFDVNKLTLHAGKTNFIIFHRKQCRLQVTQARLKIDDKGRMY